MKAVLSWLRDFTPVRADAKTLCDAMTESGSKVESREREAEGIRHVVTGKIVSLVKHPNADKLLICRLVFSDTSDTEEEGGERPRQILTGAPNVREGAIVPVALDGATLAGGVKIKTSTMRGERSEGMLCSIQELGYTPQEFPDACADGIYILPPQTPLGISIQEALRLDETMIDFEITSNRPDCFSMEGLGRELALTFNEPFVPITPHVVAKSPLATDALLQVANEAPDLCRVYHGRVVESVQIGPSPQWLQKRLRCAGVRPISNIVDITNYVMLELGQPMHAFDFQHIEGGQIRVRRANEGESLRTLDGNTHQLNSENLVIADENRPLAAAGVMGGEESEITERTTTIVFESAVFDARSVRLTAKQLGLRTESSSRFEKGLDAHNALRALERACELVEQLGCGRVCRGTASAWGEAVEIAEIDWRAARINAFLGTNIDGDYMASLFGRLGCAALSEITEEARSGEATESSFPIKRKIVGGRLKAPSFRPDLEAEADLAEEVARFYGYNRIKATLLEGKSFTRGGYSPEQLLNERLISLCVAEGYYQCMTYAFESPKHDDLMGLPEGDPLRERVKLRDTAEDTSVMRRLMLPSLLKVAGTNARRWVKEGRLFEMGAVYEPAKEEGDLPLQRAILAAAVYDVDEDKHAGTGFYRLKGLAEEIARQLGIRNVTFRRPDGAAYLNPWRSAEIFRGDRLIGRAGYVMPSVCKAYGAPISTAYMELDVATLINMANLKRRQKPLPKFPPLGRDLAFTVGKETAAGDIERLIGKYGKPFLSETALFDIYEGKQVAEGRKSMAYRLRFRSGDKTLTDDEVNAAMRKIIDALARQFDADIRK